MVSAARQTLGVPVVDPSLDLDSRYADQALRQRTSFQDWRLKRNARLDLERNHPEKIPRASSTTRHRP